jgi:L-methionine (R)-S-oxide reductase
MTETQAVERSLDEAIRHLRGSSGTIHLKAHGAQTLVLAASRNIPEAVLQIVRQVPWGKGMAGLAAERMEPVDACNLQTTTSPDVRPGARATGLQGALVVPMLRDGKVVGTFGVGCLEERTFTPDETRWLMDHARSLAATLPAVD